MTAINGRKSPPKTGRVPLRRLLRRGIHEGVAEPGRANVMIRAVAPAVRLPGSLAGLALLVSVASACAEGAAPASADAAMPKAEALLGVDPDYDHVIKYFEHAKVVRAGDWLLKYSLDEGGGALTRSASSQSTNTKDAALSVDHESKTRCDRRASEISVTLGETDARFSAEALAKKGGKAFAWVFSGNHGVFDAKPQRRELGWSVDSGDITFAVSPDVLLKHEQAAFCAKPVAAAAVATGCSVFSLKGFSEAYDYVCDAREPR